MYFVYWELLHKTELHMLLILFSLFQHFQLYTQFVLKVLLFSFIVSSGQYYFFLLTLSFLTSSLFLFFLWTTGEKNTPTGFFSCCLVPTTNKPSFQFGKHQRKTVLNRLTACGASSCPHLTPHTTG